MGFETGLSRLNWRGGAIRFVLSAGVLVALFVVLDPGAIGEALATVNPSVWGICLGGFCLLHVVAAFKWRLFLRLSGATIPCGTAIRCHGAGLFSNLCLPSLIGGDVVRAGLAMGATPSREAVVLGSVVDRLADLLALGLVVLAGAAAAPAALSTLEQGATTGLTPLWIFFGILVFMVLVAVWILWWRPVRRWPRRLGRRLVETLRAMRLLRSRPGAALGGLVLCVGIQGGFVCVNIMLGEAMGLDLDPAFWFLLWPLAKIAAMLPVSLGGIGVREAAFAALISPFAEENTAVAQSLAWETVLIGGGLVAGLGWLISRREGVRT